jgi:antitoxin (DNA-binding transcriptional repressor) of toxin-antitoxin stability system
VEAGEEIEIARRGEVVARLVPPAPPDAPALGTDRGRFTVPEDFNAPLSEEELRAFGA